MKTKITYKSWNGEQHYIVDSTALVFYTHHDIQLLKFIFPNDPEAGYFNSRVDELIIETLTEDIK